MPSSSLPWTGWLLAAFGGWWLLQLLRHGFRARASARWPRAPGHVNTQEIKGCDTEGFTVAVTYDFTAHGRSWTGRRCSWGEDLFSTEAEARRYLERLVGDGRVQVCHHPSQPARCVLEPGLGPQRTLRYVVQTALAVLLIGSGLWLALRPAR